MVFIQLLLLILESNELLIIFFMQHIKVSTNVKSIILIAFSFLVSFYHLVLYLSDFLNRIHKHSISHVNL